MPHNLASFEFHARSWWKHKTTTGLIRDSNDSRLGQTRLKNAEIAQFDRVIVGEAVGNLIKRPLDHIEDLMLDDAGLLTDGDDNVALG